MHRLFVHFIAVTWYLWRCFLLPTGSFLACRYIVQSFLRFTYAGTEFRHESLDGKICVKILHQNHRLVENDLKPPHWAGRGKCGLQSKAHRVGVCNVTLSFKKAVVWDWEDMVLPTFLHVLMLYVSSLTAANGNIKSRAYAYTLAGQ